MTKSSECLNISLSQWDFVLSEIWSCALYQIYVFQIWDRSCRMKVSGFLIANKNILLLSENSRMFMIFLESDSQH